MNDLKVNLAGVELDNPIIPASGTFGYGQEFTKLYDINILGAVNIKSTTLEPQFGNPLPRLAECKAGMLNSIGLQNPGLEKVINEEIPNLRKICHKPIIANISGFALEEYVKCVAAMNETDDVDIIEVNVGCPNVHKDGKTFCSTPADVTEVTEAIRKVTTKPLFIKLSPNNGNMTDIAKAAEAAGADGLTLINTLLGMRIDIKTRKPVLERKIGGFSGPAIFPVALAKVYQVAQAVDIPIIGAGGIGDGEDVLEMIMAGATAVQIGTENLVNPYTCRDIINNLPGRMERLGIKSLDEIRGCVL